MRGPSYLSRISCLQGEISVPSCFLDSIRKVAQLHTSRITRGYSQQRIIAEGYVMPRRRVYAVKLNCMGFLMTVRPRTVTEGILCHIISFFLDELAV